MLRIILVWYAKSRVCGCSPLEEGRGGTWFPAGVGSSLGRVLKILIDLQTTALVAQKRPDEGAEFTSDGNNDLVAQGSLQPSA